MTKLMNIEEKDVAEHLNIVFEEQLKSKTSKKNMKETELSEIKKIQMQLDNVLKMKMESINKSVIIPKLKDRERSTWWMADESKNKKMRQWLDN